MDKVEKQPPKCCLKINRSLLPIKMHYLIFMAALSCALPFRTVYAKQIGVSASAVGIIFAAVPFVKLITNPLFGVILDHFKRFRLTLAIVMFLVATSHLAMVFIPSSKQSNKTQIKNCSMQTRINYSCSNYRNFTSTQPIIRVVDSGINNCPVNKTMSCYVHCDVCVQNYSNSSNAEPKSCQNCDTLRNFPFVVDIIFLSTSISGVKLQNNVENRTILTQLNKTDRRYKYFSASQVILINDSIGLKDPGGNFHNKEKNSVIDVENDGGSSGKVLQFIPTEETTLKSDFTGLLKHKLMQPEQSELLKSTLPINNEWSVVLPMSLEYNPVTIPYIEIDTLNNENSSFSKYVTTTISHKPTSNLTTDIKLPNEKYQVSCLCNARLSCYSDTHNNDTSGLPGEYVSLQFWLFLILMSLSSMSFSAVLFLMDAVCYEILEDRPEKYGEQRLWGTVGWGIGALLGGYFNELFTGDSDITDYSPSFYLLAGLMIVDFIPLYFVEVRTTNYSSSIFRDVRRLFCKLNMVINMVTVFFVGVLSGLIWNYEFWFLEELGASQVLLGLSQTVQCFLAELPCFLIAGWIIKRIGYMHCNSITFLFFGFRYICYAYMKDPWLSLPVGLLHGPTFGLFFASMTAFAKSEAPSGTEATVQALLAASYEGVGVATGSILGGIGFDTLGSRTTLLYAGVSSFALLGLNIIVHLLLRCKEIKCGVSKDDSAHEKQVTSL